jgi:8-oxo-dGTP pyrophosphatase MutT (NUDIX family)
MTETAAPDDPAAWEVSYGLTSTVQPSREQLGALCWRIRRGRPEVLLITSRDTRRWIIPKGWPIGGFEPSLSALREAWEEAGVRGTVAPDPVGEYRYVKTMRGTPGVPCTVVVYTVKVGSLASTFPERQERRRRWFSAQKAARKLAEAELCTLILAFGEVLARSGGGHAVMPGADAKRTDIVDTAIPHV